MWGRNTKPQKPVFDRRDGSKVQDERRQKSNGSSPFLKLLYASLTFFMGVSGFFVTRWIDSVESTANATEIKLDSHITETVAKDLAIATDITILKIDSKYEKKMLLKIDRSLELLQEKIDNIK